MSNSNISSPVSSSDSSGARFEIHALGSVETIAGNEQREAIVGIKGLRSRDEAKKGFSHHDTRESLSSWIRIAEPKGIEVEGTQLRAVIVARFESDLGEVHIAETSTGC